MPFDFNIDYPVNISSNKKLSAQYSSEVLNMIPTISDTLPVMYMLDFRESIDSNLISRYLWTISRGIISRDPAMYCNFSLLQYLVCFSQLSAE